MGWLDDEFYDDPWEISKRTMKMLEENQKNNKVNDDMRRKRDFNGNLYDRELLDKISDGRWCLKEEIITCNGVTYHKNDEFIVKDLLTGELSPRDQCVQVITDIRDTGKELKFEQGYVTISNSELLLPLNYNGDVKFVLNQQVFDNANVKFVEDYKLGHFILKSQYKDQKVYMDYKEYNNPVKKSKDLKHNFKYGIESPTYLISEGKNYTFGVEIETIAGLFPSYIRNEFNFKCVYDGSLKDEHGHVHGGEYVSGVLKGDKGFEHLKDFLYQASRRCQIGPKAGIHVHIGVSPSPDFIVYLYKLCKAVENDMFKILPQSRKSSPHCRPLDTFKFDFTNIIGKDDYKIRIDEYYSQIYQHYASKGYRPSNAINKLSYHPKGANGKCGYDQNSPRYCWLNLIPAMFKREGSAEVRNRAIPVYNFGNAIPADPRPSRLNYPTISMYYHADEAWLARHRRNPVPVPEVKEEESTKYNAYTVEFRLFPASLNFSKIKNHIKICMALVYYAENCQGDIQKKGKISLEEVILAAYPKRGHKLITFIKEREQLFSSNSKSIENNEYKESENMKQSIIESINS